MGDNRSAVRRRQQYRDEIRRRLSLGLGEVIVVDKPGIVRTVLGSCVAIILHVPRLRLSTLCHAEMPEPRDGLCCRIGCPHPCQAQSTGSNELRYVSCCFRCMLAELRRRSVDKSEIVSTLVGGAHVISDIDPRWCVADRNVAVATEILMREGIPINYSDVGGMRGRLIEHVSDLNHTTVRYHGNSV